ncbi:MAG: hypothetical protein COA42_00265 [Alteromonadaceae bacterium]|nr:MAG: hypothetical protein COA42_00265 [Alteromonadaceae bacterium]
MEYINQIVSSALILALAVTLSVLISTVVTLCYISAMQKKHHLEVGKLQRRFKMLNAGAIGMGEKILRLEARARSLHKAQEEMRTNDLDFSYAQAQKLIERGIDSDQVAVNSGLSSSEIQLMQLLHQQDTPVKQARPKKVAVSA